MAVIRRMQKPQRRLFQTDEKDEGIYISFEEPLPSVYLQVQKALFTIDGVNNTVQVSDDMKLIAELTPLAVSSIVEVEGATVELEEGVCREISSKMDLPAFNKLAGKKFSTWQAAFAFCYPDYVAGLASHLLSLISDMRGVPKVLEKNSERVSDISTSDAPESVKPSKKIAML